MIITTFYILSIITIIVALGALYIPMIEAFPIKWTYYHYHFRKIINWSIIIGLSLYTSIISFELDTFPYWTIIPFLLSVIGLILTYKVHQEVVFKAIDFPKMTAFLSTLPIKDEMELAIIEHNGVTKCYPLDFVVHHHIINDDFNDKTISLTYCAMCRSIIPFEVSEIGSLFVGSFKGGNMIVADKKTKTFFQQSTFKSIIGKLHPMELTMITFQILPWKEVKKISPIPEVSVVTKNDLRKFELPIPGVWEKLLNSEKVPGLFDKNKDKSFPARTRVIGIWSMSNNDDLVYLKKEVVAKKVVINREFGFVLIRIDNSINGYKTQLNQNELNIIFENNKLIDSTSKTEWNIIGKYIKGKITENLEQISISDEYWFSWKKFHPKSQLIRIK